MQPEKLLRFVLINGAAVGVGMIVATSCIDVDYPQVAFRCSPRESDNCPETHFCCSDDPAAIDGKKPNYLDREISDASTPYFSGENNGLSSTGMCIELDGILPGAGLSEPAAPNCPIPCNPTWSAQWIADVCGPTLACCQTVALEPKDCILDASTGQYRPVNGGDIGTSAGQSPWGRSSHATHQDPSGEYCGLIAAGDDSVFLDCVRQLSVADQRGFCRALPAGELCPTENPTYVDACTALNAQAAPPE